MKLSRLFGRDVVARPLHKSNDPTRLGCPVVEAVENRLYCADTAGNNFVLARNLGTLTTPALSVPEQVSSVDRDDFYKFAISTAGNTTLNLSSLTSNADLQLYNSTGSTLLAFSSLSGTSAETITKSLSAGTYFARVKWVGPSTANYVLKLTPPPAAADPGSTPAASKNLGNIGTAVVSFSNSINKTTDTVDFYKITTTAKGLLKIKVIDPGDPSGTTLNVKLSLFAANGTTLLDTQVPNGGGIGSSTNVIFHGTAGSIYYVKISNIISPLTSVSYQLQVSNPAVPADTAGNTRATATAITSSSTSGFIVSSYNQDNWYKKTITASVMSQVVVEVRGSGASNSGLLKIAIVNASGTVLRTGTIGTQIGGDILDFGFTSTQVVYIHVYQSVVGANGGSSPYQFSFFG